MIPMPCAAADRPRVPPAVRPFASTLLAGLLATGSAPAAAEPVAASAAGLDSVESVGGPAGPAGTDGRRRVALDAHGGFGMPPPAWLAVAVLAGLAAGGWSVAGLLRERQRLLELVRAARSRAACVEPLFDAWTWQTDRAHLLIDLRPPAASPVPPADRRTDARPSPLWERFAADEPDALRALLDRGDPIDALAGRLLGPHAGAGLLSGRAYSGEAGGFGGYHGIFRALGADRAVDAAATAANLQPSPTAPSPEEGNGVGHATVPTNGPKNAPAVAIAELPPAAGEHELMSFTVSHDLRAPIRVVEGFTKILKEDYGSALDRIGNDHLDRVLGAAARMNNMIDALMALSRLSSQPLVRQPVDLSQLGRYVLDDLRRQSPEREAAFRIAPDLRVVGDPTLLRIVLENLLGNAWKYTGRREETEISLQRHAERADTYTVADNGAGFDMRFADRLFGVFQRLHGAGEFPGTGIGLATVRRILRRHGGDIWAEAEVDRGARFHFSLPGD